MHHVYVLYSPSYDKIYIGETSNLAARFTSHNQGSRKGWTARYRPWALVHPEEVPDRSAALKREKQLKSAAGRRWVWGEVLKRGPKM